MSDENNYPVSIDDLYPGTTFHYRKDSYSPAHLHIILTDPDTVNGTLVVVTVNLTTRRNTLRGTDTTVVLDSGDHSFIERTSVISYRDAEFFQAQKLLRYINEERCLDDDLDEEI